MSYLSADTHKEIIANPGTVSKVYERVSPIFTRDLGPVGRNLSNGLLTSAFAAICAWDLKPYGKEPPKTDLPSLLQAPSLACDDYVRLALYFMKEIPQCAGIYRYAVGWEGGAVGNHAQLFVSDTVESMLLDPTIGLVVRGASYDGVTMGRAIGNDQIKTFFAQYGGTPSIAAFNEEVIKAVSNGLYRPSDALYFCASLNFFNSMPPEATWPTPAAAKYQRK